MQTRRMDVTFTRRATAPAPRSGTAEEEGEGEEEEGGHCGAPNLSRIFVPGGLCFTCCIIIIRM